MFQLLCRFSTGRAPARKQLGMFWRFLFAMFLASVIGMELFVLIKSLYDEHKLFQRLASPAFAQALQGEMRAIVPALALTRAQPQLCGLILQSFATNRQSLKSFDDTGTNSVARMVSAGRVSLHFKIDGHTLCSYPAVPHPATGETAPELSFQSAAVDGQQLLIELRPIRSPALLWEATKEIPWNILLVFVAFLNLCCAITLAPILVRRIKRAEVVARGWTRGNMHARINDNRNDEFGQLVRSFNTLADSFVDVIKVKQELAAVEERNRLARDLHDTAKQRAFALNLQLTALGALQASGMQASPEAARLVGSAATLAHHLQNDLSNVIKRLSASTVAELGMREVLRREVASLFEGSGISWEIDLAEDIDIMLRSDLHLAQQVLLIAIEASANVLKHAQASKIRLSLRAVGERYQLLIEDDGRGIDAQAAPGMGMGLANMKFRAQSLPGGEFTMSNRGEGSRCGVAVSLLFYLPGGGA